MDTMGHHNSGEEIMSTLTASPKFNLRGKWRSRHLSDEAIAEIRALADKNGGEVKAEQVLAVASDEESALHKYFEWDDTEAARRWRLDQARHIIVTIMIEPAPNREFRALVSLRSDREVGGGEFRALVTVMRNKGRRTELLEQALDELRSFEARYTMLAELAPVFAAASKVRDKLS